MVGQRDGMSLVLAGRARQKDRWKDSVRENMWCDIGRTSDPARSQGQLRTHLFQDESRLHQ